MHRRRDFCATAGAGAFCASQGGAGLFSVLVGGCNVDSRLVEGIVWQPDNDTVSPRGNWHLLGAKRLLIQWSVVDGQAYLGNAGLPTAPRLPDWQRIASEPWAQQVIMGLAGRFDEGSARTDIAELVRISERLARVPMPLNVVAWYFPVEIDPTWAGASRIGGLLSRLPRPLWISAYDGSNIGPDQFARAVARVLPGDVGVFFQDGVGSHVRTPAVAKRYVDVLRRRIGRNQVRLIAEAFRPNPAGGFRPATAAELKPQLASYTGYGVYLFDGPHYVSDQLVEQLVA